MLTLEELRDCLLNDEYVYDGYFLCKIEEIKSTKDKTSLVLKSGSMILYRDFDKDKLYKLPPEEVAEKLEAERIRQEALIAEARREMAEKKAREEAIEAEKKRLEELAKQERQARIQHLLDAAIHIDRDKIKSMNLQKIAIPDPDAQWGDDPPMLGYIVAIVDDEVLFAKTYSDGSYGLRLFYLCDSFMKEIELL